MTNATQSPLAHTSLAYANSVSYVVGELHTVYLELWILAPLPGELAPARKRSNQARGCVTLSRSYDPTEPMILQLSLLPLRAR